MHFKARSVLLQEAEGLKALAEGLPSLFEEAINLLLAKKGKVIFSGMGKSAHIARKIAATFSSIGTASFFIHPAESLHGDLGALSCGDVLIILSKSAETKELLPMLHYSQKLSLPSILITMCPSGTLEQEADCVLALPEVPEACPLKLAPTTSSCMMLGLGDALAMTLLEERKFTEEDYHQLHPGGMLGHQLRSVKDIMHKGSSLPLVTTNTYMGEALLEISNKGFGCVGIIDENQKLVGVISDGDLRRHMSPDLMVRSVVDVMTKTPKTISACTSTQEALLFMNTHSITVLFVVDEKHQPEGLIHMHDCLRVR